MPLSSDTAAYTLDAWTTRVQAELVDVPRIDATVTGDVLTVISLGPARPKAHEDFTTLLNVLAPIRLYTWNLNTDSEDPIAEVSLLSTDGWHHIECGLPTPQRADRRSMSDDPDQRVSR